MRRGIRISLFVLAGIVVSASAGTLFLLNFVASEATIERSIHSVLELRDEQFLREANVLLGAAITSGNRIEDLHNGDEIFPAMLGAIEQAQHTITMETFIYWSGDIGRRFADALCARAEAGVSVHVIVDAAGSDRMDDDLRTQLTEAGVQLVHFHPLSPFALSKLNNRTHRKLLIVDGRVGFTGGVGIADDWLGDGLAPQRWRDMHFRAEGPVVAQMQAVFNENWIKVTGEVLNGPGYFPQLAEVGQARAQTFSSSPRGGAEKMHLMYLMAIESARATIDIEAAYFVPDELTAHALARALDRGVKMRLLLPSANSDSNIMRIASRGFWARLLRDGCEIYLYEPAMLHSKLMIVDQFLVSVGSTNFDSRSFLLNDEANLNVYDEAFARHMTAVFERDTSLGVRVDAADWHQRPLYQKWLERAVGLLNSQL